MTKLWSERENQQDATVRSLLSTLSQHVSGIIMSIFRRTRRVLLHVVCCAGSAGCGWWRLWGAALLGASTVKVTVRLVLASYNTAPHNRHQPHPAEPAQHTTCSNTRLVLLKMGIMMPETCWKSIDNKHLTVASYWFSLSLHNTLTMHGHRNLKLITKFSQAAIHARCWKANKRRFQGTISVFVIIPLTTTEMVLETLVFRLSTTWRSRADGKGFIIVRSFIYKNWNKINQNK